jgi:MtaA/CmuA family methyltransferase
VLIRSLRDIEGTPPADPSRQGRQPLMLEALWRIVEAVGDEIFVVACFDQSPFSLACAVGGLSEVMVRTRTDRPFVEALLERCIEYTTAYGRAMGECGAHMLSTGDSPAALVGPELYRELCLPAERRVFQALREETAAKLSLHICGDTRAILPDMVHSGADVLEIDHLVDIEAACHVVPEEIAIWGNVDPVDVLLRSDEPGIRSHVTDLLDRVHATGRDRFVLSSGCALAPDTPTENLHAFFHAAREWRGAVADAGT